MHADKEMKHCTYDYRIVTYKHDGKRRFSPSRVFYSPRGVVTSSERILINESSVGKIKDTLKQVTTAFKKPILDMERGYVEWKGKIK